MQSRWVVVYRWCGRWQKDVSSLGLSKKSRAGTRKLCQIVVGLNMHCCEFFFLRIHSILYLIQSPSTWASAPGEIRGVPDWSGTVLAGVCEIYVRLGQISGARRIRDITASLADLNCAPISWSLRVLFNLTSSPMSGWDWDNTITNINACVPLKADCILFNWPQS